MWVDNFQTTENLADNQNYQAEFRPPSEKILVTYYRGTDVQWLRGQEEGVGGTINADFC